MLPSAVQHGRRAFGGSESNAPAVCRAAEAGRIGSAHKYDCFFVGSGTKHASETSRSVEPPRIIAQAMRSAIKEATASMTSVPKPLKFLRGHYGTLKETLDTVAAGDNRRAADARN